MDCSISDVLYSLSVSQRAPRASARELSPGGSTPSAPSVPAKEGRAPGASKKNSPCRRAPRSSLAFLAGRVLAPDPPPPLNLDFLTSSSPSLCANEHVLEPCALGCLSPGPRGAAVPWFGAPTPSVPLLGPRDHPGGRAGRSGHPGRPCPLGSAPRAAAVSGPENG